MRKKITPQGKRAQAPYGSKQFIQNQFAEWDKAVERCELRRQAIADWEIKKNNSLRGVHDLRLVDEIIERFDGLFCEILKKYPIESIHDYQAFGRVAGLDGYHNGKKFDQFAAAKSDKQDALQTLIVSLVKNKPALTATELKEALRAEKGLGVIEDMDDENITFADKGGSLKDAPISGLKDRLSRAKKKIASRKPGSAT